MFSGTAANDLFRFAIFANASQREQLRHPTSPVIPSIYGMYHCWGVGGFFLLLFSLIASVLCECGGDGVVCGDGDAVLADYVLSQLVVNLVFLLSDRVETQTTTIGRLMAWATPASLRSRCLR